jgi:type I restriction enzyme S subunit
MDGCSFISQPVADSAAEFALQTGDILIAMTGYIADVAIVRDRDLPAALNQRVGRFSIRDPRRLDQRFIFYLLRDVDIRKEIEGLGYGSAQPNVSPSLIHGVEVPLPPLPEQRAIAHILGTLDDKIELNRRMSETLEAMARALFKSWFVDFDPVRAKMEGRDPGLPQPLADLFPGSFEDSELGEIPRGWDVGRLGEFADIQGGKQLPTEECRATGSYPVFGANGIMGYTDRPTHSGFVIAFGRVGAYCGSIHWAQDGAWINNNASSEVPMRRPEFVLQSMLNVDFEGMRTGSAQPFIPNSSLSAAPIMRAPDAILDKYCATAHPLRCRQASLEAESRTLAGLRGTLLPKLISGELRVTDAERFIGRAV